MGNYSPAAQTVILLSLFLVLGVPVLAWAAVMRNHSDASARWWYAGLACSGAGVLIVVLLERASAYTACCMVMSVLFCSTAMRLELGLPRLSVSRVGGAYALFAAVAIGIDMTGQWQHWGVPWYLGGLFVVEACLLYWMVGVIRLQRSRGLVVAAVGLSFAMLVNAVRTVVTLSEGSAQPLFSFVPMSMAAIISVVVAGVLMTLGYAMFSLEKANRRHLEDVERAAQAEAQRRLADAHAQELQEIIEQRDEMIVINSRFSAVHSLALYNSTIVHEISQSAQGLTSILDTLNLQPLDERLRQSIDRASLLVGRMAATLQTLRGLMAAQPPTTDGLDVNEALEAIWPILRSEARRRGQQLQWSPCPEPARLRVNANKVLLERIVFNLVTNAFEALGDRADSAGHVGGRVELRTRLATFGSQPHVVIEVEDDGPGISPEITSSGILAFKTSKSQGVGLGLSLARIIAESWRGRLELADGKGPPAQRGTVVGVWIPLCDPVVNNQK